MADGKPAYYLLDLAGIPDELYADDVPVDKWLSRCETATAKGFPTGSLARLSPVDLPVHAERLVGISLYMLCNVLPFALPVFIPLLIQGYLIAKLFFGYLAFLIAFEQLYRHVYPQKKLKGVRENQYCYADRHNQKYSSMKYIWPSSLHFPACDGTPLIFCMAPHGVAPLGITSYAFFSKLFNRRLCHPTAAPIVLKLPFISEGLKAMGFLPAKAQALKGALVKKEESISVILDGVAGMFQQDSDVEKLWLNERKGICKIALQTGCPIVPVYGFGHTSLWSVITDPFGILERISIAWNVSICPFYGRFGWPIGPPRRKAVAVAFGDPITTEKIEDPTEEQINELHARMIEGFRAVFEQHKDAYGWGQKKIAFI